MGCERKTSLSPRTTVSRGSRKPSRSGSTFSRIALGDDTSSDASGEAAERSRRKAQRT